MNPPDAANDSPQGPKAEITPSFAFAFNLIKGMFPQTAQLLGDYIKEENRPISDDEIYEFLRIQGGMSQLPPIFLFEGNAPLAGVYLAQELLDVLRDFSKKLLMPIPVEEAKPSIVTAH